MNVEKLNVQITADNKQFVDKMKATVKQLDNVSNTSKRLSAIMKSTIGRTAEQIFSPKLMMDWGKQIKQVLGSVGAKNINLGNLTTDTQAAAEQLYYIYSWINTINRMKPTDDMFGESQEILPELISTAKELKDIITSTLSNSGENFQVPDLNPKIQEIGDNIGRSLAKGFDFAKASADDLANYINSNLQSIFENVRSETSTQHKLLLNDLTEEQNAFRDAYEHYYGQLQEVEGKLQDAFKDDDFSDKFFTEAEEALTRLGYALDKMNASDYYAHMEYMYDLWVQSKEQSLGMLNDMQQLIKLVQSASDSIKAFNETQDTNYIEILRQHILQLQELADNESIDVDIRSNAEEIIEKLKDARNQMIQFREEAESQYEAAKNPEPVQAPSQPSYGTNGMLTGLDKVRADLSTTMAEFKEKANEVTSYWKEKFGGLASTMAGIIAVVKNIGGTVSSVMSSVGQGIASVSKMITGVWTKLITGVKTVTSAFGKVLSKFNVFGNMFSKLGKTFTRLGGLIKRVFVFSVFTKFFRALRTEIGAYLGVNTQLQNSLSSMKGAWLTAFQPIYEAVVPIIITLVNWLTVLGKAFASLIALITGKSVSAMSANAKAMYEQAHATESAGSAAEEASKQLMGFDELNVLNDTSSGGGGAGVDTSAPDFNLDDVEEYANFGDWLEAMLDRLIGTLPAINEAFTKAAQSINGFFEELYEGLTREGILDKVIEFSTGLADAFNILIRDIDFGLIGKTVGAGLNLIIYAIAEFLDTIDWKLFGQQLANGFNGMISEIDFEELGKFFAVQLNVLTNTLDGFVSNLDWDMLGDKASQLINGFIKNFNVEAIVSIINNGGKGILTAWTKMVEGIDVDSLISQLSKLKEIDVEGLFAELAKAINSTASVINEAINKIDWKSIGTTFGNGINKFISDINWKELGTLLSQKFNVIIDTFTGFINTIDLGQVGSALATALSKTITNIHWRNLGDSLSKLVTGIIEGLKNFIDTMDWRNIGAAIGDAFSRIKWGDVLSGLVKLIASALHGVFELAIGILQGIDWGNLLSNLVQGIGDAFVALLGAGSQFISDILELGANIIKGLLEGIGGALVGIATWLKQNVVDPIVNGIKNLFGIHSPSTVMKAIGENITEGLLQGIQSKWSSITQFFSTKLPELKKTINDKWDSIKKDASTKWGEIKDTISKKFTEIQNDAKEITSKIKDEVTHKWDDIKTETSKVWNDVKDTVTSTISQAKDTVDKKANNIKSTIEEKWNNAKNTTQDSWNNIKDKIEETISKAKDTVEEKVTNIKDVASENFGETRNDTDSKWEEIKNKITDKATEAYNSVKSNFDSILSNVRSNNGQSNSDTSISWSQIASAVISNAKELSTKAISDFNNLRKNVIGDANTINKDTSKAFTGLHTDLVKTVGKIYNDIYKKFSGLKDDLGTLFSNIGTAISEKVSDAIDGAKKLASKASTAVSNAYKAVTGSSTSTSNVKRYASGGVITKPTYGLMGEYAGASSNPEIVTPQSLMAKTFAEVLNSNTSMGNLNAILSAINRNTQAVEENRDTYIDGQKVTKIVTKYQNQNAKLYTSIV